MQLDRLALKPRRLRARAPFCLALLATTAAETHLVPFWTDDYGYCKQLPGHDEGVHRPHGLEPLVISLGDAVSFTFSTHHDVWSHADRVAFDSCNYSDATMLADRDEGGGCAHETDAECMAAATPWVLTPTEAGTLYLSCSVGDHCANGQRIVITVEDPAKAAWRGVPSAYAVPFWTDDYGYCKTLPGYDEGVHRPHGLEPMTVPVGQPILFSYSTHHDVWSHPSLAALEACDYSAATMLADRDEGGGCAHETDAACMAAATPWVLTPTEAGTLYLSCGVGDHCANGQRIVITVEARAAADGAGAVLGATIHDGASSPEHATAAAGGATAGSAAGLGGSVAVPAGEGLLTGLFLGIAGTLLVLWAMFKRMETQRAAVVGATSSTAGVPRPGGSEDPSHVVEHASAAPL